MLAPETAAAEADCLAPLSIHLFGPFEVSLHGQPLPRLRSRKGQWLLALLALRQGCEGERAWLASMAWSGGRSGRSSMMSVPEREDRCGIGARASSLSGSAF